jgi:hypothetical protein
MCVTLPELSFKPDLPFTQLTASNNHLEITKFSDLFSLVFVIMKVLGLSNSQIPQERNLVYYMSLLHGYGSANTKYTES